MKLAKFTLLIILGLGFLPQSFASGRGESALSGAPYPWPWPWAVGCPIKWSDLERDWQLPDVQDGSIVSIRVSRIKGSSMIGVHVRRSDPGMGVHSDGFKRVEKDKRNVIVDMLPQREGVQQYKVRIGVYLYQAFTIEKCDPEHIATVMSFLPVQSAAQKGFNYVLDVNTSR